MKFDVELVEAQKQLIQALNPLDKEWVPLANAGGRVVAEKVTARHDLPPCRQSAVDGFAVSDEKLVGVKFRLLEKAVIDLMIGPREACMVVTGGVVPEAARTVIPYEHAEVEDGYVTFSREVKSGRNMKSAGEDLRGGTILARPGDQIDSGLISIMAAFGYKQVLVHRRPQVGILSLGQGIIPWQNDPLPDQVRDSNSPLLISLVDGDGGIVVAVETAGDDRSLLNQRVMEMLGRIDVLIVTGGTHAGEYDEARQLLEEIGAETLFWGVKIRPGSHPGAALWDSRMIICLSGNPGACMVGYHMLAAPVVRYLQGLTPFIPHIKAVTTNSFDKAGGPRRLVRAHATIHENTWKVEVLPGQKSSMLRSYINCNALIDLPAGHPPLEAGSEVSVILLNLAHSAIYPKRKEQSTGGEPGNV
jgi:molybdopterin molybdotransferase